MFTAPQKLMFASAIMFALAIPVAISNTPEPSSSPSIQSVSQSAKSTHINVNLSGDQSVVDKCLGPVLFDASKRQVVVEHDGCGGWNRFSHLEVADTVVLGGSAEKLVLGRFKVFQKITITSASAGGTPKQFEAFTKTPNLILQTCIPGTTTTLAIGLEKIE